ncbi:MAG: thioredoxin family protein [Candidatus Geothermarchaeales archaeon]
METQRLKIGSDAPVFVLPAVDGREHALGDFDDKEVLVVAFSCNHCPTVVAYEDRMIALQRDYAERGVALVAINSNDPVNYPEDRFEAMVERSREKGFNFAYLRDRDQTVATSYGATHTPEFFVFDRERKLRYHGRLDDNRDEPDKVTRRYVREAMDAMLRGGVVETPETYSVGCTIKWST